MDKTFTNIIEFGFAGNVLITIQEQYKPVNVDSSSW